MEVALSCDPNPTVYSPHTDHARSVISVRVIAPRQILRSMKARTPQHEHPTRATEAKADAPRFNPFPQSLFHAVYREGGCRGPGLRSPCKETCPGVELFREVAGPGLEAPSGSYAAFVHA